MVVYTCHLNTGGAAGRPSQENPWDLLASQSGLLVRLQVMKDPISKTKVDGAEEMAQRLRVLAALAGELSLVPSTPAE